jgi:hypothetical protein
MSVNAGMTLKIDRKISFEMKRNFAPHSAVFCRREKEEADGLNQA